MTLTRDSTNEEVIDALKANLDTAERIDDNNRVAEFLIPALLKEFLVSADFIHTPVFEPDVYWRIETIYPTSYFSTRDPPGFYRYKINYRRANLRDV